MKLIRAASLLAAVVLAFGSGCGSKSHGEDHSAEKATPAPAPPTPDTTPIDVLRTPAGLVLKTEGPTPTPVPAK